MENSYSLELTKKYNLPEKSLVFLESIEYQEEEDGRMKNLIKEDLEHVCEIASRYDDPIKALYTIDDALAKYMQLKKSNGFNLGSIEELNMFDAIALRSMGNGRKLVLNGLIDRIEEHLLFSNKKERIYGRARFTKNIRLI